MDCISILIIFIVFIDRGDGHWDKKERENLRHDIEQYKRMAEKIEREIENYYYEYPEARYDRHNGDKIAYEDLSRIPEYVKETINNDSNDKRENNYLYTQSFNMTENVPLKNKLSEDNAIESGNYKVNKSDMTNSSWPKFDDMLLAIGKKYDWKNDRWIKVKRKLGQFGFRENVDFKGGDNNSVKFHEKHRFKYRIVKLNKGKSRRNVVVAVSAVR